eukprot:3714686-Pyramimonas_sp.AAC.1
MPASSSSTCLAALGLELLSSQRFSNSLHNSEADQGADRDAASCFDDTRGRPEGASRSSGAASYDDGPHAEPDGLGLGLRGHRNLRPGEPQ